MKESELEALCTDSTALLVMMHDIFLLSLEKCVCYR
jgi:hypothetical protein